MKNPRTLLRVSVIGTVLVALCCFTPILVILLATVGLAALTGYLDYVLWRKKQYDACCDHGSPPSRNPPHE
jgi:hypothetical protein